VVLPDSRADPERARRVPGYFADTAIPALLEAMGALLTPGRVVGRLVGGAAVLKATTVNVGFRNGEALRRALWRYRIPLVGEDLGGERQRGLALDVESGRLEIRLSGGELVYL
jgi:chemotaxis protein CheD